MLEDHIKYRSGYKYQLSSDYSQTIEIFPGDDIDTKYIKLSPRGELMITEGYAWDGPSGPVIDTRQNMRASLVHDALYQLMRFEKLNPEKYKDKADELFREMCIQDGVPGDIAEAFFIGLQIGGKPATDPRNQKETYTAP